MGLQIKLQTFKTIISCFIISIFLCFLCGNKKSTPEKIWSDAEYVMDVDTLSCIHEKDADKELPMASTTKILTAIIIIENCDLSETAQVPKESELVGGSSVYLKCGDQLPVIDLLYGMMLRSGNDCAVALSLHHSKTMKDFVQVMNEKANRIGAEHSHFCNPHGMPDPEHYTTARDLAFITAYALQNETFREIVSCRDYANRGWKNKNKLLSTCEGAIGVKTGFTKVAGRCLVSAACRNNKTVICVVLNSPNMYERTKQLIDEAFLKLSEKS